MTALLGPERSRASQLPWPMPVALARRADAQDDGVQVCVEGTAFCSVTDANGNFVLVANVSGNVVLIFTGVDFTARLVLTGIPMGAIVTIRDIECSTSTGRCTPQRLEIEEPTPTPMGMPLVNQPPVCTQATASPSILFPPNHEMMAIVITDVTDPDGDEVAITPISVFQDEPVLDTGSGNTAPDATLHPLAVRAERSGQGNGRVYTVDFMADDGRGGSCTGSVEVCVPHDQGQGSTCINDGALFDSLMSTP